MKKWDMRFFAICKSLEDAQALSELSELSKLSISNRYGWNQKWIDSCNPRSWGIEWWKNESPPVIPDNWSLHCYWQGSQDITTFFADIQKAEIIRKNAYKATFSIFDDRFPNLEWEVDETDYYFSVRVVTRYGGGSGASPVSLETKDFESVCNALAVTDWNKSQKEALMKRFPNLYFSPGGSKKNPEVTPAMQAFIGGETTWTVYTAYMSSNNGEMCCGTATKFYFEWPMSAETEESLKSLERESAKSQQKGWFFCTICQCAYPQSEYGYYYFAETRCVRCLTPKWERTARAETYN